MIACERTEPDCEQTATAVLEYGNGLRWAFCDEHAVEELHDEETTLVVDATADDEVGQRVQNLEKLVEALRKRIKDLEDGDGPSIGGVTDPRDVAVLAKLELGETVRTDDLIRLYQAETDVSTKQTLKKRVRELKARPELKHVGYGEWKFVGGEGDDA